MTDILIIYHKEDNDGACSAGLIKTALEHTREDESLNINFWGVDYAMLTDFCERQTPEFDKMIEKYDEIYLTDMSFNSLWAMNALYKNAKKFVYFDHHASIIEASKTNEFGKADGLRDTSCSAILCVWKYYFGEDNINPVLQELSDYDSWQWVNKDYKEDDIFSLNIGFTIRGKLDPEYFACLTSHMINGNTANWAREEAEARQIGLESLLRQREHCKEMIKEWGDLTWTVAGHKACALFSQEKFSSKSFISLSDTDIQHGIVFRRKPTGDWVVSAYNVSDDVDFHLGLYLREKWNGGGHKGAAGCTITQEQFINILTNKSM